MKIAYCIHGTPINETITLKNIQTHVQGHEHLDFFLQSTRSLCLPEDFQPHTLVVNHAIDDYTSVWWELYQQLNCLQGWPIPHGAIQNMLCLDSVVKQLLWQSSAHKYDLIVLSDWKAHADNTIDYTQCVPLSGLHFARGLSTYAPNPLFMVTSDVHVPLLMDLHHHVYNWLAQQQEINFPWGLVQGWPGKYNWGLILAQYLHSHGIVCHHRDWPVSLAREPVVFNNRY
jgi:hypothetical protein